MLYIHTYTGKKRKPIDIYLQKETFSKESKNICVGKKNMNKDEENTTNERKNIVQSFQREKQVSQKQNSLLGINTSCF